MNLDDILMEELRKPSPILAALKPPTMGILTRRQKIRGWWYWHVSHKFWQRLHDLSTRHGAWCEDD